MLDSSPNLRRPAESAWGLDIEVLAGGGRVTLVVSGELDLATAPELHACAHPLVEDASELVLDLGGLSFMDSTGLYTILRLRSLCRQQHCRLLLTSVQPPVRRLLEVCGVVSPMEEQGMLG